MLNVTSCLNGSISRSGITNPSLQNKKCFSSFHFLETYRDEKEIIWEGLRGRKGRGSKEAKEEIHERGLRDIIQPCYKHWYGATSIFCGKTWKVGCNLQLMLQGWFIGPIEYNPQRLVIWIVCTTYIEKELRNFWLNPPTSFNGMLDSTVGNPELIRSMGFLYWKIWKKKKKRFNKWGQTQVRMTFIRSLFCFSTTNMYDIENSGLFPIYIYKGSSIIWTKFFSL